MDKKITIISVNYNTSDFIDLMLYAFESLTYYSYEVIICDNGSKEEELIKLINYIKQYKDNDIKLIVREQSQAGSIGHAEALDLLVSKVTTPYFVTMDADATVVQKHWDKILIDNLVNNNAKGIGTPVVANKIKKSDFPLIFCAMYETKTINDLKCSFMPNNISKGEDTGYDLKEKFLKNNINSILFEVKNTRYDEDIYFSKVLCATYYFNNSIICSHFGRGSSGGGAKYKKWYYWHIPILSKYIRNKKYINEKKLWINISKNIIDKEIN